MSKKAGQKAIIESRSETSSFTEESTLIMGIRRPSAYALELFEIAYEERRRSELVGFSELVGLCELF